MNRDGGKAEAGVWVIAETKSLSTPYLKTVVTNDAGRFVVPDLPKGEVIINNASDGGYQHFFYVDLLSQSIE